MRAVDSYSVLNTLLINNIFYFIFSIFKVLHRKFDQRGSLADQFMVVICVLDVVGISVLEDVVDNKVEHEN